MLVTVIIPVYNSGQYLRTCLDSIQNQTYKELEIIIINDGSTDESGNICDEYSQIDKRVCVIHKQNEGQSIARNVGLSLSLGEYVMFVDSDDYLPLDAIEHMVRPIYNKRYTMVGGMRLTQFGSYQNKTDFMALNCEVGRENKKIWKKLKVHSLFGYCTGKLYETHILKKHDVKFDDIRKVYMEDALFNLKLWVHHPSFYLCEEVGYVYQRYDGTSSNKKIENIEQRCLATVKSYLKYLEEQNALGEQMDLMMPLLLRISSWAVINNMFYEKTSIKTIIQRIKCFSKDKKIQQLLHRKDALKQLLTIPSIPQKLFYALSMICMKWHMEWVLTGIYLCGSSIMKIYANQVLDRKEE